MFVILPAIEREQFRFLTSGQQRDTCTVPAFGINPDGNALPAGGKVGQNVGGEGVVVTVLFPNAGIVDSRMAAGTRRRLHME